ncbi:MAG: PAS domain S-box-containing protein [Gammaproteobacteria bacterium]
MTFRLKTILGIALNESILLVILVFSALDFLRNSNEDNLQRYAITTSRLFKNAIKDAVLSMDLATLESFVEEISSNPDIVYTRIVSNGVILAQGGNALILKQSRHQDKSIAEVSDGIYDIRTEIVEADLTYGVIEMGLSTDIIDHVLVKARQWIGGIASLEIILVALFSFILGTYLTRQLLTLKKASNIIALSGPGYQIPISGNDEISDVARAFNEMSNNLNKVLVEQERVASDLTQLIDSANAPIFGIDADGKVNEWNQQAEKITGYKKDDVMGQDLVADFITEDYKDSVDEVLAKALNGDETANFEFPLFTESGDRVDVLLNSTTRRDASGRVVGVVGVGQDITELNQVRVEQEKERKEATAQIIQSSKLATLGEMATSVAHELNQPLNVIRMASGNVRRKVSKGTADAEYLNNKIERIEEQTARAAAIINHMRMFGRNAKEYPEPIDARSVVTNALDLMGEQLRLADIEIVTELAEDCPSILGHIIQLEQVILNLLTNASDAMAENDGDAKITLRVFEDGKSVHIKSEDNGGGIPDDVLPRIFEPFYTTKEMGKGTGLGLSVSYGIVRDMNGTIVAENIDDGARFTITLPIVS